MSNGELFVDLTDEEIVETKGAGRTRGEYDIVLGQFLDSESRGRAVNPAGLLEGKSVGSIQSGLNNARKRLINSGNAEKKAQGESVKVVLYKKDKEDTGQVRVYRTDAEAA